MTIGINHVILADHMVSLITSSTRVQCHCPEKKNQLFKVNMMDFI